MLMFVLQQGVYIRLNSRDHIRSHLAQYYKGLVQPESNVPVISVPYVDFYGLGKTISLRCVVIPVVLPGVIKL